MASRITEMGYRKGLEARNKGDKYPPTYFQPAEVLRLLEAIPQNFQKGRRDRALFAFLWRTGVRLVELPNIRESDLDEGRGTVHIRRQSNRAGRDVILFGSSDAADWGWQQLRQWLETRSALGVVSNAPLFCVGQGKTRGAALKQVPIRKALDLYKRKAKLHGEFTLRAFRHTLAAELFEGGVSIGHIQRQLGHDSLATTQSLLERLGVVKVLDDLHDYRPSWRSDEF